MKTLSLALFALILATPSASASQAYGTIGNFDVVNDTGHECHGFEIELEDCHSTDISYTYDYNHYGKCAITEGNTVALHPKTIIRWASAKKTDGSWAAHTIVPTAPIAPTNGHMFTNPAVNFGGEHFGVGYRQQPTGARYYWLCDNGSGALVRGPEVQVAMPTFVYNPPAGNAAGNVVAVIAPPPAPAPVKEFGEPMWVKEIKTTTHNNNEIKLRDLQSDDPVDPPAKDWRNFEPDEVEVEWQLLQEEFNAPAGGANGELEGAPEDLDNGDEVVTRRYEFYAYTGPFDTESYEAMADSVAADDQHGVGVKVINGANVDLSTKVIVGEFLGAQMAAFDQEAKLDLIEHVSDGRINVAYAGRQVVISGAGAFTCTRTGSLPPGMSFNTTTGILSGTPTGSGSYQFSVQASDALAAEPVKKNYTIVIAAAGAALPEQFSVDTLAAPLVGGSTTGDGAYAAAANITVTATPNAGYQFLNWTDNDIEVSTSASFTFTTLINRSLIAHFIPIQREVIISAAPAAGGSFTGDGFYDDGSSVTVTATPNAGYTFTNWMQSGTVVSSSASYTFAINATRTLVVNFSAVGMSRTIATSSNPVAGGTVSGAGIYADGSSVTVTATPNAGYTFANWTQGGAVVSSSASYTFTAAGNPTLVAVFVTGLSIAVSANPPQGGSVEADSPSYEQGDGANVQADANAGYTFLNWTENGNVVSTNSKYVFTITTSRTLVANFFSAGSASIALSASPVAGGTVSGGGTYAIGAPVTAWAHQANGYKFSHWSEGGISVNTDEDYQFAASASRTLIANFVLIPAHGMKESDNPDELEFEWPANAAGWVLQESTDMATWVNSTRPVTETNGKKRAKVNKQSAPGVFFRLVKP
jgi:hypothetical protein